MASNRHHALPRSLGGNKRWVNGYANIRKVNAHLHWCWHCLFSNYSAHKIAEIINETWLDPTWEFKVVRRKRGNHAKRNRKGM